MANIEAGNQDQLMIRDVVESYGLEIGTKTAPGIICAVSSLENIYTKYGVHVLSRVLRLIVGAWEGDVKSFSANVLNAVTKLCVIYKGQLNDEIFKEKCGAISVKALGRIAKERRPGAMGFAEAMVIEYNGKKKNSAHRLDIRLLFARDVSLWAENGIEDDEYDDSDEFPSDNE